MRWCGQLGYALVRSATEACGLPLPRTMIRYKHEGMLVGRSLDLWAGNTCIDHRLVKRVLPKVPFVPVQVSV